MIANTKGITDVKEQLWLTNVKVFKAVNLTLHGH